MSFMLGVGLIAVLVAVLTCLLATPYLLLLRLISPLKWALKLCNGDSERAFLIGRLIHRAGVSKGPDQIVSHADNMARSMVTRLSGSGVDPDSFSGELKRFVDFCRAGMTAFASMEENARLLNRMQEVVGRLTRALPPQLTQVARTISEAGVILSETSKTVDNPVYEPACCLLAEVERLKQAPRLAELPGSEFRLFAKRLGLYVGIAFVGGIVLGLVIGFVVTNLGQEDAVLLAPARWLA